MRKIVFAAVTFNSNYKAYIVYVATLNIDLSD